MILETFSLESSPWCLVVLMPLFRSSLRFVLSKVSFLSFENEAKEAPRLAFFMAQGVFGASCLNLVAFEHDSIDDLVDNVDRVCMKVV